MVVIVDELVGEVKLEPEIPENAKDACAKCSGSDGGEPWSIGYLVLLDFNICVGTEHPAPDNEEVEVYSERPLASRPFNTEDGIEDLEDVTHYEGVVHEGGD